MPTKKEDLPSTLKRSPEKVQRTYAETLDSALEQYGDEERAHRTAFAAVKHIARKRATTGSSRTRRARLTSRRPKAARRRAAMVAPPAASTPTSRSASYTRTLARQA